MNFKSDWSFLEKISMGAVSSKTVVEMLNASGHRIIELERYSTSNKIWSTKIKRLRLPDLICLKCGRRIESRAKKNLEVKMSDNENNPDRRWDVGLRDEDLIAFVHCDKENEEWVPSQHINAFSTKSLRDSINCSKLGKPKSADEGAEKDRTWKTSVPKKSGVVVSVIQDAEQQKTKVKVCYDDGGKYTFSYPQADGMVVYCKPGDKFGPQDTVIAGVLPEMEHLTCDGEQYDFFADISSNSTEIRYAGVKALGYLEKDERSINTLYALLPQEKDPRIILEAYSSLIRLGEDVWDQFYKYAISLPSNEYVLEFALILGELQSFEKATDILIEMAGNDSLMEEIRAAAVWGIPVNENTLEKLVLFAQNENDMVSSHALANIEENMRTEYTGQLLSMINSDCSGEIILSILKDTVSEGKTIVDSYFNTAVPITKKWVLLIIGLLGRDRFDPFTEQLSHDSNFAIITALWDYSKNAPSADYCQAVNFLRKQSIRG